MPACPICGSPNAHPHFGGISCRACAVFFRRNCLSNKNKRECTCASRLENSHPCQECRMKKCLAIGMHESYFQINREKTKISKNDSLMTMSLVNPCRIIPRDSPHISSSKASSSLPSYEKKLIELYGGDETRWNVYDSTSCVRKDSETIWSTVSNLFPQVHDLKYYDKDSLMSNFVPKWCELEPAIDRSRKVSKPSDSNGTMDEWICRFYKLHNENELDRNEIIRKISRFWTYHGQNVIWPIVCQQFDDIEFLAILLLLFFDNGYTNITDQCAEMCRDIRKVILRELRSYQRDITDNDDDGANRFLSTVEVPLIIEKGEKVFEEEMLVCEMHHIRIHEDFLEAMRRHNL